MVRYNSKALLLREPQSTLQTALPTSNPYQVGKVGIMAYLRSFNVARGAAHVRLPHTFPKGAYFEDRTFWKLTPSAML